LSNIKLTSFGDVLGPVGALKFNLAGTDVGKLEMERTVADGRGSDMKFFVRSSNAFFEAMRITNAGYIGIGTVAPSARLSVETADSTDNNFIRLENKGLANSNFYFGTANNKYSVFTFRMAAVLESYRDLHISAATAAGNLFFETGRVDGVAPVRMMINNIGNVGIGTTTPGPYKLAVEGTIGARKIKVTQVTPWADFVFDSDYKLPAIHEVEAFISINKHLPDIPSAAEVTKDGIDVGEMNQKLLQKIEEQMLYIIEMNKKVTTLTNEVKDLKEKVAAKQ